MDQDELVLLETAQAVRAVADDRNWWRYEDDPAAEPYAFGSG